MQKNCWGTPGNEHRKSSAVLKSCYFDGKSNLPQSMWPCSCQNAHGSAYDLLLKLSFHFRPFGVDDAEEDAIAFPAIRHDPFMSDDSFFFCTGAQDGCPRFFIQFVRHALDTNHTQCLKSVSQKQEFFSVLTLVRCADCPSRIYPISSVLLERSIFP